MADGVVKKGVILKATPGVTEPRSVNTDRVPLSGTPASPLEKGRPEAGPKILVQREFIASMPPKDIPQASPERYSAELWLEKGKDYAEGALNFLKTPNSPSQQLALAFTFVFAVAFLAIPRFHTEGRSIRTSLMTYGDLEGRLLRDHEEEIADVAEIAEEEEVHEVKESPLKLLLDDLEERLRSRGHGHGNTRVINFRQPIPQMSKSKAVAVMKTLAYNHPKVPLHPGTKEFDKVRQQVLKVIRSHSRKGTDVGRLASEIVSESWTQKYDPLFVAAVIKSESAFNTFATSNVGAKGLMQLMPDTGKYVADISGVPRGSLTDPGYNLKLGITYLKHLEEMFDGNRVLTLIAYNWGPGHLTKTMKGEKRGVPRSVMNYALKILGDHSRWVSEAFGHA